MNKGVMNLVNKKVVPVIFAPKKALNTFCF